MLKMVCIKCAIDSERKDQWEDSVLCNYDDTCMSCGVACNTAEVDMPVNLTRYQIIQNVKVIKGKIWS